MLDRKRVMECISAGITASSPDNNQPFKFKILDDGIELRLNNECLGMFFDAENYASLLGCGGVLEFIRLAATRYGYQTEVEISGKAKTDQRIATIRFLHTEIEQDPLAEVIPSRCSYRGFFNKEKVSRHIISQIESSIESIAGAHLHWFAAKEKKDLIRIITDTDRLRYVHKRLYLDFHSKLRFGAEIEKKRDGLAAPTLGIEPIFTALLPFLKPWSIARALNLFGIHYFMAWRGATVPLKNASEICALIVPRTTHPLEQGKALHRLWLAINANEGLHCQIFGALPLFMYRMKECNGEGFSENHKVFLKKYIAELESMMNLNSDSDRLIVFFRLGYAQQKVVRSLRRPVESFLVMDS